MNKWNQETSDGLRKVSPSCGEESPLTEDLCWKCDPSIPEQ